MPGGASDVDARRSRRWPWWLVAVCAAVAGPIAVELLRTGRTPASLLLAAGDGEIVGAWCERDGGAPTPLAIAENGLAPGPVALRIVRRGDDGRARADIVRLTLVAGHEHLIAVGDAPVELRAEHDSGRPALVTGFFPPGAVDLDASGERVVVGAAPAPATVPPPMVLSARPVAGGSRPTTLSARDGVLLLVNPFADTVECTVEADGWSHALALPGPVCRPLAIGAARRLRIVGRLMPGGEVIDEHVGELAGGLPLYTIGGATLYRWTAAAPATFVPVPSGRLAFLPERVTARLPAPGDPPHWLLACTDGNVVAGLTALSSDAPPVRGEPPALVVRPGVEARELRPPAPLAERVVTSVASDGNDLIGVIDGGLYDLATGAVRCPTDALARAAAGPDGLVLLTHAGALATVRDGRLVVGAVCGDPTTRILPMRSGGRSGAWLADAAGGLRFQSFDGLPARVGRLGASDSDDVTALARAGDGVLIARGRRIDRLTAGACDPVLILPNDGPAIVGLLELDGGLLIATGAGVSLLRGEVVAPLVDGVGGPLERWRGAVVVHDARTRRLFRLDGPALGATVATRAGGGR